MGKDFLFYPSSCTFTKLLLPTVVSCKWLKTGFSDINHAARLNPATVASAVLSIVLAIPGSSSLRQSVAGLDRIEGAKF